jgi:hypothetical protein
MLIIRQEQEQHSPDGGELAFVLNIREKTL